MESDFKKKRTYKTNSDFKIKFMVTIRCHMCGGGAGVLNTSYKAIKLDEDKKTVV